MLLSICIPSYNRPFELKRLLESIDCDSNDIEIVISEDYSPLRNEIIEVIENFSKITVYEVKYFENKINIGYDANIRKLIDLAIGEFVVFMGDDDRFYPNALDKYINFVKENSHVGYILRSYYSEHPNGKLELFRYLPKSKLLEPTLSNCSFLYKRTVSIAGVTFKRDKAIELSTSKFDGTLLYQLYIVLEITYKNASAYCDIPFAIVAQTFRLDKPYFGTSKSETKFTVGKVTPENSIAFTKGFFEISEYFDSKYNQNITKSIRLDLSKYSYPILSIQRKNGFFKFLNYSFNLSNETKINTSIYFYIYTFSLLFLGEKICDKIILNIKNRLGYTPSL